MVRALVHRGVCLASDSWVLLLLPCDCERRKGATNVVIEQRFYVLI